MAEERDLLLREVDEELRRDQFAKIWETYGTYIVAAAALIVVGVGGFKWSEARALRANEAAGARFEAASELVRSGKADEALAEFQRMAKEAPAGYALLSQLSAAGSQARAGKTAEAVAAFDSLAKSASDPLLADFARLQAAALKIDSVDWTEMQNRLNDLSDDKNPWRHAARELLGLAALRAERLEDARKALQPLLTDRNAPGTVSERARIMMSMIAAAELARGAAAPAAGGGDAAKKN
jgi:hypothetical protein